MYERIRGTVRINAHSVFIAFALIFGLFFVFTTPLLWGSDETSHVGRVYQITQGHVFPRVVHQGYSGYGFGGTIPSNLMKVVDYVNIDFNSNSNQAISGVKWVDNPADYKAFSKLPLTGKQLQYNFSNTAVYSPVSYAPAVVGFKLAEVLGLHLGPTIYLARISGLIFYIALLGFVIRSLAAYRVKWLIFAVALLPMPVFQSATINGDTVTISLAIAVVGLVIKSLLTTKKLSRTELVVLTSAIILIPIVKPSYIFISLLAFIVPTKKVPVERFQKFILPVAVVLGVLAYGVWQYKTRYLSNAPKYIIAGVVPWWQQIDSTQQIKYVLHHPFTYAHDFIRTIVLADNAYFDGLFGKIGFDYVQVPAIAIIASFSALLMSVFGAETFRRNKRVIAILASVIIVSVLAVFGTLYLTISSVGSTTIQGVQGRYLYPILPVLLLLLIYISRLRLNLAKALSYRNFAGTICGLTIISLLASAIKFYYVTWG